MIIKFLRSNLLSSFIFTPLLAAAIWIYAYNHQLVVAIENPMPFYDWLLNIIGRDNNLVFAILGYLLIVLQAFHLNFILNQNEVLYKNSWLPAMFYVIFMSIMPQFVTFHPLLISNSIFIIALQKIFKLYKGTDTFALDFDIGFLISIASLFYFTSIVMFLLFLVALIILKPFAWRDWIIGLIGLTLPYLFTFFYYFMTNQYFAINSEFFTTKIQYQIDIQKIFPREFYIGISFVVLLFLISILKLSGNFFKNVIRTRNYQQVIFFSIFIFILSVGFSRETLTYRFAILSIPFSVIIPYYFVSAKRTWIYESLFILLLANLILNYRVFELSVAK